MRDRAETPSSACTVPGGLWLTSWEMGTRPVGPPPATFLQQQAGRQAGATVRGQQVSLSLGAVELEGGLPGGGDREHMGNSICKGSKLGEFQGLYGEVRS